jgi:hypothetical protein
MADDNLLGALEGMCLDLSGQSGVSPLMSTSMSQAAKLASGWWATNVCAGACFPPHFGDLVKSRRMDEMTQLMKDLTHRDFTGATLLVEIIHHLHRVLHLYPDTLHDIRMMQRRTAAILNKAGRGSHIAKPSPDIRRHFEFPEDVRTARGNISRMAKGRLGVPGIVAKFRDETAQSNLSSRTGDDAGHLIASRFGAPGGGRNLGLQNWIQNRWYSTPKEGGSGTTGTWYDMEQEWTDLLKGGVGIEVEVEEIYHPGDERSFMRRVGGIMVLLDGTRRPLEQPLFFNSGSVRGRAAPNSKQR